MPLAIAAASVTAVETADWTGPYAGGSLNLTTFVLVNSFRTHFLENSHS